MSVFIFSVLAVESAGHPTWLRSRSGQCRGTTRPVLTPIGRDFTAIVVRIHDPRQRHLFGVVHAIGTLGFLFGLVQRRQKHGGENRDDRNNHQQLRSR